MAANGLIAFAWVITFEYWVFATLIAKPRRTHPSVAQHVARLFPLMLGVLLLAGAFDFYPLHSYMYEIAWPVEALGAFIVYCGFVFLLYVRLSTKKINIEARALIY